MYEIIEYDLVLDNKLKNELREKKKHKYHTNKLNSTQALVDCFNDIFHLKDKAEEYVCALGLNLDGVVLGAFEISHGTTSESLFSYKAILTRMLLCGADRVVMCHNHCTQRLEPSPEDRETTQKLKDMCETLGIELWDDIIVTKDQHYSMDDEEW